MAAIIKNRKISFARETFPRFFIYSKLENLIRINYEPKGGPGDPFGVLPILDENSVNHMQSNIYAIDRNKQL